MGKGDKKTRKGKITIGTFGVRRPKKANKPVIVKKKVKAAPAKPKATTTTKASPAKKKTTTAKAATTTKAKSTKEAAPEKETKKE